MAGVVDPRDGDTAIWPHIDHRQSTRIEDDPVQHLVARAERVPQQELQGRPVRDHDDARRRVRQPDPHHEPPHPRRDRVQRLATGRHDGRRRDPAGVAVRPTGTRVGERAALPRAEVTLDQIVVDGNGAAAGGRDPLCRGNAAAQRRAQHGGHGRQLHRQPRRDPVRRSRTGAAQGHVGPSRVAPLRGVLGAPVPHQDQPGRCLQGRGGGDHRPPVRVDRLHAVIL